MAAQLGLDIGSRSVKAVELVQSGQGWRLNTAGVVGFTQPVQLSTDQGMSQVADVIKKLITDIKVSAKETIIAIPESQAFTRLIKLPPLTDQEVASAIKWEAEQYIPIPVSEAVVQHAIVGRQQPGQQGKGGVDVLLVAAPKKLVENYLSVVQAAGLKGVAVETDMLALSRSVAPAQGVALIVDFGATSTDIGIVHNSQLFFSRSIPTAGEAFTRAVGQSLGVDATRAEEYKRAYGLSQDQLEGKIRTAINPVFKIVADEMKKAMHYYQTELQGTAPSIAVLTGGTTGLPDVVTELTNILGIEVTIGDPFQTISVDPAKLKSLVGYGPLYAIAVGVAKWQ